MGQILDLELEHETGDSRKDLVEKGRFVTFAEIYLVEDLPRVR
jgi:hypothetical protein